MGMSAMVQRSDLSQWVWSCYGSREYAAANVLFSELLGAVYGETGEALVEPVAVSAGRWVGCSCS